MDKLYFIRKYYNHFFICIKKNYRKALELIIKENIFNYYHYNKSIFFSPLRLAIDKKNNEILKIILD